MNGRTTGNCDGVDGITVIERLAYILCLIVAGLLVAYERIYHELWWQCVGKHQRP
jgi:hypothetical protein